VTATWTRETAKRKIVAIGARPAPEVTFQPARSHMFDDVSIRFVTREDYDGWLPLWHGYNAFYGRSGTTALSPDITRISWARFFDAYEPMFALVAESGGQLLGLTHYLLHRSTTCLLFARLVHSRGGARQGRRPGPDQRGIRAGAACRIAAGLLADARNQPHGDAALRQGCGPFRIRGVPQNVMMRWIGRSIIRSEWTTLGRCRAVQADRKRI
jgi:hypothetical protein